MRHELKCWEPYISDVLMGIKTMELRFNDRNYKVGDILILREFDPITKEYGTLSGEVKVTHIYTGPELHAGYCVMSVTQIFES